MVTRALSKIVRPERTAILQGTLDMLILRTLLAGPAHGHAIARHIQRTSDDTLQLEHGSLYPALHRLVKNGWIAAKWEMNKERKREFKYYRLTPLGRKQLAHEQSKWALVSAAIQRILNHGGELA
ncbi:MAG TPA: PadR family transcriptional regulator [Terriglobales bacterium]|nr:PadR family transcriptional regulator [Terriglobales bacterium]